jgi:dynein heavy chain, axonemal
MTTKLINPHYLPDVSTKATIINFMITDKILCDQLLNLVVKLEDGALEEERTLLIQKQYENNLKMFELEQKILDILKSTKDILEDENAIKVLDKS